MLRSPCTRFISLAWCCTVFSLSCACFAFQSTLCQHHSFCSSRLLPTSLFDAAALRLDASNDFPPVPQRDIVSKEASEHVNTSAVLVEHLSSEPPLLRAMEIGGVVVGDLLMPLMASLVQEGVPDCWDTFWAQSSGKYTNAQRVTRVLEQLGPTYVKVRDYLFGVITYFLALIHLLSHSIYWTLRLWESIQSLDKLLPLDQTLCRNRLLMVCLLFKTTCNHLIPQLQRT